MATFGVIDTSATGDTYYEGFVKDAANWALVEAGLSVVNGGTGRVTSTTAYGLVAAGTTATGAHQTLAAGLTTQILVGGGTSALPAWGTDIPTAVTIGTAYIYRVGGTDITVADGGTGVSTLTDHGILLGSGTGAITPLGEATHGQIPIGSTGADPVLATITGTAGQIAVTNAAGSITLSLDTIIKTVFIPAAAMTPTTTAGCAAMATNEYATNDINMDYLAFDGASEEYAEFQFPFSEQWNLGTIKAKIFWSSASGSTAGDTVEWELAARAISNDDAIDAALGTAQVISDTLLANNGTDLQVTGATPALTVGGTPVLGDLIHFKISRNVGGTDDMTEDAWLFGVWIQFSETVVPASW